MANTQPLRTAFIGLPSTAAYSWGSTVHLPALLSPTGRSKFRITALLNSSIPAAEAAIQRFGLDPSTKAYGSPEALAQDKDIDVVICNTRVDKHYKTILPSVKAGKDVYVEWPIASKIEEIREIVEEAKKSGGRVAVGLQRRWAPEVIKIREIIEEGKFGKVLSSEVRVFGGSGDRAAVNEAQKYFIERNVGGNLVTIILAHLLDFVCSAIGELEPGSVRTKFQRQRPNIGIKDMKSGKIVETVLSDVPDLLLLHGSFEQSLITAPSATLSLLLRRGQPFPGTPALSWSINLEKGELRLIGPSNASLTWGSKGGVSIQIHHYETDELEDVAWTLGENEREMSEAVVNISRVLYAFADGKPEGEGWLGLEEAARRAEQINSFLEEWVRRQA
ncbi:putative oxidoreductase [Lojkania enalia]|uniref:Oxidoreductase n=1 Tax=Lojkania enalia TaxID=147567 RepID=A0A9P4N6A9_9PLEO|nr:putative oxidoreductase [Didymosphaeria enalia]